MKFDFSKSNKSDFRNKLQMDQFDIMNKNLLYITYEMDKIHKIVTEIQHSSKLQKQVDEYFDKDETSPQTDSEEQ